MRNLCCIGAALVLALLTQPLAAADFKLAATHTLEDSGLLKKLIPTFEARSGVKVRLAIGGTGQVIRLLRTATWMRSCRTSRRRKKSS
jgi:ABC-type tungstate transport system permease subunit